MLYSRFLFILHTINVYLLIPNSWFIPPQLFFLVNCQVVFYVFGVYVYVYISFVNKFICIIFFRQMNG